MPYRDTAVTYCFGRTTRLRSRGRLYTRQPYVLRLKCLYISFFFDSLLFRTRHYELLFKFALDVSLFQLNLIPTRYIILCE